MSANENDSKKVVIIVGMDTILKLLQGNDVETTFGTLIPDSKLRNSAKKNHTTSGHQPLITDHFSLHHEKQEVFLSFVKETDQRAFKRDRFNNNETSMVIGE